MYIRATPIATPKRAIPNNFLVLFVVLFVAFSLILLSSEYAQAQEQGQEQDQSQEQSEQQSEQQSGEKASSDTSANTVEPKIELGAGIAIQSLRDYRGSSEHQTNALPFPYIVYRGTFIELDRDSAKGKFFSTDFIELSLSADASYTEDSKNNPLRLDMDPLDPTFELGPSLEINLTGEDLDHGWMARIPVRGVFAVDLPNISHVGMIANPKLTYKQPDIWTNTNFKFDTGLVYGDAQYHDYIYGVSDQEATLIRPAFEAQSGYSGLFLKAGLDSRIGDWWLKGYIRYDNLAGSENESSPLYQSDHYLSIGFAVARIFWQSSE